jgi:hypothetical protein
MGILQPQVEALHAEVLIEKDDGKISVGAKRNMLLSKATRKYCAFVDDDDTVSHNYVLKIIEAIERGAKDRGSHVDCIGMCGYIMEGTTRTWQFRHSVTVGRWCKDKAKKILYRTPNHLNPIRSNLAKRVLFPEISWGEDKAYSDGLKSMLKTEVFIEEPIYFYKMGNK